jgi:hypothetical protein
MSDLGERPRLGSVGPIFIAPSKAPHVTRVTKNSGYFLMRIHSAQASYLGDFWDNLRNAANQVIVTSELQMVPHVEEPIKQIQAARRIKPNQAVQLGMRPNLTDWIPASIDTVRVKISVIVDRKDRLAALSSAINSSQFLSAISLSDISLATAKALGSASRSILDAFLEPDTKKPILEFVGDFNVASGDLQSGYHVLLSASDPSKPLPDKMSMFEISEMSLLLDGEPVRDWSYLVLEVLCIEARDRNPQAKWDKLLRNAEEVAESFGRKEAPSQAQRSGALLACEKLLSEASSLLRSDPNYLSHEVSMILAATFARCRADIYQAGDRSATSQDDPQEFAWADDIRSIIGISNETNVEEVLMEYSWKLRASRDVGMDLEDKERAADNLRRSVEQDSPDQRITS